MPNTVRNVVALIIPFDIHAGAVRQGLLAYDIEFDSFYPCQYPYDVDIAFRCGKQYGSTITLNGRDYSKGDKFVFWSRRRGRIQPLRGLVSEDQRIAEDHSNRLIDSVAYELSAQALLSVNDSSALITTEKSKLLQLSTATRLELSTPDTLISNDPAAIRAFIASSKEAIIGKALGPATWSEEGSRHLSGTTFVDPSMLPHDDLLRAAPVILQKAVRKAYEVRVQVMGSYVLAARLDTPDPNGEDIDWRTRQREQLRVSPLKLPESIEHKLIALMRALGLAFGAIDLIVQPDGTHTFIEVNQMGQFLWVEQLCPELKILDTFCQFLASADLLFSKPAPSRITYEKEHESAVTWCSDEAKRFGFTYEEHGHFPPL